jgi:hypothetical protein
MKSIDQNEMRRLYPALGGSKFIPESARKLEKFQAASHVEQIEGDLLHEVTLPINLTNDNGGRSQHWSKANKRKREFLEILASHMQVRTKPFPRGVTLVITRILGKRQQKWDNDSVLRGSSKELLDSLVQSGWFEDDGPEFIKRVIGNQTADFRHEGPAVWIEVLK